MKILPPLLLLPLIFLLGSCLFAPPSIPSMVPDLESETVALVASPSSEHPGHIYCTAVWIAENKLLTAAHCIVTDTDERGEDIPAVVDKETWFSTAEEATEIHEAPTMKHCSHQIKIDRDLDLAVLLVDGKVPAHRVAQLAEETPAVGEALLMMGHPIGILFSLQEGMVSSYRHKIENMDHGPYLQMECPSFWHGDSGGGVFNRGGELVGIMSFMPSSPGIGFAVHLDTIRNFIRPTK